MIVYKRKQLKIKEIRKFLECQEIFILNSNWYFIKCTGWSYAIQSSKCSLMSLERVIKWQSSAIQEPFSYLSVTFLQISYFSIFAINFILHVNVLIQFLSCKKTTSCRNSIKKFQTRCFDKNVRIPIFGRPWLVFSFY